MVDVSQCQEYFDKVVEFAKGNGSIESLRRTLAYVGTRYDGSTVTLYHGSFDLPKNSFHFVITKPGQDKPLLVGGICYCASNNSWSSSS